MPELPKPNYIRSESDPESLLASMFRKASNNDSACSTNSKNFVSGAEDMTLTTSDKAKIDEYHRKTS